MAVVRKSLAGREVAALEAHAVVANFIDVSRGVARKTLQQEGIDPPRMIENEKSAMLSQRAHSAIRVGDPRTIGFETSAVDHVSRCAAREWPEMFGDKKLRSVLLGRRLFRGAAGCKADKDQRGNETERWKNREAHPCMLPARMILNVAARVLGFL